VSPYSSLDISSDVGSFRTGGILGLLGKHEGKRALGRHRRRWEDNIKMDFQEVGFEVMDWIDLDQDMDRWRNV
jgi:hypothetical protein